jgi:Ca2+-binding EF-hand superfamily protein
MSYE